MHETSEALRLLNTPLGLHLLKNPAGTWSFVGSVPMALRYKRRDGQPIDDTLACKIATHGVGLFKADVTVCTWPTRDEAITAATALGATVRDA